MPTFFLFRRNTADDECSNMVVRADSEADARVIAASKAGIEGPNKWDGPEADCEIVTPGGPSWHHDGPIGLLDWSTLDKEPG